MLLCVTFLKIQILNRPQIHSFFPCFFCTDLEEENGVRIFNDESCEDVQDMYSPDEEDEHL